MEPIKGILGRGDNNYLNRIYLATKLQEKLRQIHPEPVAVSVRNGMVVLTCQNAVQAEYWRLRRRRLYGELSGLVGRGHRYAVRIRVRPSRRY